MYALVSTLLYDVVAALPRLIPVVWYVVRRLRVVVLVGVPVSSLPLAAFVSPLPVDVRVLTAAVHDEEL